MGASHDHRQVTAADHKRVHEQKPMTAWRAASSHAAMRSQRAGPERNSGITAEHRHLYIRAEATITKDDRIRKLCHSRYGTYYDTARTIQALRRIRHARHTVDGKKVGKSLLDQVLARFL